MNDTDINDCRLPKDFKHYTFSKFSRSKVKTELIKTLYNNDIERANYWSVELICAGHFYDLWNILILYMSRYVHLANPKLPIYMFIRFQAFKKIILNGYIDNELNLRNNHKIRQILAELVSMISYSKKKHAFESLAVKDTNEFDITNLTKRLKASNIHFAQSIFKDDPKEIFIAINEFIYSISPNVKDTTYACYWFEWLTKFEHICKNKKKYLRCERRSFPPVDDKYQMDIIWLIWEALLAESDTKSNNMYKSVIEALLNIYCIRYTSSIQKSRKYIIYYAISILTDEPNFNIPLTTNKQEIEKVTKNIDVIYKEVKKNEVAPQTDYLFTGIQKSNLDKTMEKLEKMSTIKNVPILKQ